MRDGDGEAQDAVLPVGGVDGDEAVEECLAGDDVLLHDVEVDQGRLQMWRKLGGYDATWW
ncbi:putative nitrogen permease regulator 2 [Rosellinia necatrix]|uniref:Putative nitrogen permease regulator 2 n=1 Tax=Rosellinia necatrix TaxID=77044 RepID=A0A1S8AAD0_ROSNE|nr:putative nitrogen permease regulator 2 [Rosellinia necatrix]